jgi:hypothetical protein
MFPKMTNDSHPAASLFSQVDITPEPSAPAGQWPKEGGIELTRILRDMLAAQDRQNELLEEMVGQFTAQNRQRNDELNQWRQANPHLADRCREAAETLSRVQTSFLHDVTEEITDNSEALLDGEFMLNEFVDRYGPRLAHLNGVLQILSQLSAVSDATTDSA